MSKHSGGYPSRRLPGHLDKVDVLDDHIDRSVWVGAPTATDIGPRESTGFPCGSASNACVVQVQPPGPKIRQRCGVRSLASQRSRKPAPTLIADLEGEPTPS